MSYPHSGSKRHRSIVTPPRKCCEIYTSRAAHPSSRAPQNPHVRICYRSRAFALHAAAPSPRSCLQWNGLKRAVLAHKSAVFRRQAPGTRRRGRAARRARRPGWPRCRSRRRRQGGVWGGDAGLVRRQVQVWRGRCVLSLCRFQGFSVNHLRQNAHWKTTRWASRS